MAALADNGIAITATDLTTQARIFVPADDVFATCLPARELLEFVASVDRGEDIAISSHGDAVRLVAPGTTFELSQRPTAELMASRKVRRSTTSPQVRRCY